MKKFKRESTFSSYKKGSGHKKRSSSGYSKGPKKFSDRGKKPFDKKSHRVICAKCGKRCEVPFKPRTDKPVLCSTCFSKNSTPKESDQLREAIDLLNWKVDKILKSLDLD